MVVDLGSEDRSGQCAAAPRKAHPRLVLNVAGKDALEKDVDGQNDPS
jgi:hypothetical protein